MSNEGILKESIKIGNRISKNRFVIQPMECCDSGPQGVFSENTHKRYDNLFAGGAGIIVLESVTLQYESRVSLNQLMLDVRSVENRRGWETFIRRKKHEYPDTIIIFQVCHTGELSNPDFSRRITVKPMEPYGGELIGESYIDNVIKDYVEAARFLDSIGVDGIDLKFCHGYLGSQIVRPYNDRLWTYGGSFENRARFAYGLCEKVRAAVSKDFLIGAKISVYDGLVGGQGHAGPDSREIDLTETAELCKGLESRGVSFFLESLGSQTDGQLVGPTPATAENVLKHLSASKFLGQNLKPETVVICGGLSLLGDGGRLVSASDSKNSLFEVGEQFVADGDFDMIALGRQSLADPYLPAKYMRDEPESIDWCFCCNKCSALLSANQNTGCVVYDDKFAQLFKKLRH